jgi:hypothetical protein
MMSATSFMILLLFMIVASLTAFGGIPAEIVSPFRLDFQRPVQTAQGPSTPQIIAFAMISSGRDDRLGMFAHVTDLIQQIH